MCSHLSLELMVEALRSGIMDYVIKRLSRRAVDRPVHRTGVLSEPHIPVIVFTWINRMRNWDTRTSTCSFSRHIKRVISCSSPPISTPPPLPSPFPSQIPTSWFCHRHVTWIDIVNVHAVESLCIEYVESVQIHNDDIQQHELVFNI